MSRRRNDNNNDDDNDDDEDVSEASPRPAAAPEVDKDARPRNDPHSLPEMMMMMM